MTITYKDIDPEIAQQLHETACAARRVPSVLDRILCNFLPAVAAGGCASVLLLIGAITWLFGAAAGGWLLLAGLVLAGLSVWSAARGIGAGSRRATPLRPQQPVSVEAVRRALALPSLSRAERGYLDVLALVIEAEGGPHDDVLRSGLAEANALVSTARRVKAQQESVLAAMRRAPVPLLEAERKRLAERVTQTEDDLARQTLIRSLRIAEERESNARALGTAIERLDAQDEVIIQSLSSAASAVTRLLVAPASVEHADLLETQEALARVGDHARAVEQAVEEVAALRAGAGEVR